MENSILYAKHKNIVKELNIYNDTTREHKRINKDAFDTIYDKAKEFDLKVNTAKEFLTTLSRVEMSTLRKYDSLADDISIDTLTDEGAYNLLMHQYEKYDFDGDGAIMDGAAKTLSLVPQNMDDDAKKSWVKALNTMGDDWMSITTISMSFNDEYLKRSIAENFSNMSDSQIAKMQESASFDIRTFIDETLSQEYKPKTITILDILGKIDNIINQNDGGYSSPELIKSTKLLKETLKIAYAEVTELSKTEKLLTQKELEIKQEVSDKSNVVQEEPLAVAIQSTIDTKDMTNKEIIAKYRAMPGQGGVAFEGMFEEQNAKSLAKHEDYFMKEYENYKKYKDVFTPIYSNYTTQKANKIGQELNAQFPQFQQMREKAYMGGDERDKEAFQDMFWDYQAFNKYLREKYDMDMSTGGFMAATKESSKAYNYAIYDALESGLSIKEATAKAGSLLSSFGGREAMSFSLLFFSGLPNDIEEASKIPEEEIDYDKQIDLRKYGFEHNFYSDAYLDTYGKDSIGTKSRIMYDIKLYSFLLENEDVIDSKLEELKDRAYETKSGKDWYDWQNEDGKFNENFKSGFQKKYDDAIYAKEIYDKYADKIFDNSKLDKYENLLL